MTIILKRDQKEIIPILLENNTSHPRESKDRILDQVENDSRIDVVLAGEGAEVNIVGLVMSKGSDEKTLEAYITHAAPNTKSNVNVRAVLMGKSKFDFRGNVKIEKGAKGADAYLRSDVLLFDEAKMGDDTPALEILEPDVKAGHAATIGKVDEQMLFYLMSRGLSRKQAEELLVEGFIGPIKLTLNAQRLKTKAKTELNSGVSR